MPVGVEGYAHWVSWEDGHLFSEWEGYRCSRLLKNALVEGGELCL